MVQLIKNIQNNIEEQFKKIYSIDGIEKQTDLLEKFEERLEQISKLIENNEINPSIDIKVSKDEDDKEIVNKTLRIGILPTAGNPLHWAHILTTLDAIVEHKLDKIIYIIQGEDDWKPDLLPVEDRYPMNQEILGLFEPLFKFTGIANTADEKGTLKLRGEYNSFRILQLNPDQKIDAFYLVGSDHLNRYFVTDDGVKRKDTIACLEENIAEKVYNFNPEIHSMKALFIARDIAEFDEKREKVGESTIDIVKLIPTTSTSSTSIRKAIDGTGTIQALEFLPYITYKRIKDNKFYGCE